jgi:hypothetical protein
LFFFFLSSWSVLGEVGHILILNTISLFVLFVSKIHPVGHLRPSVPVVSIFTDSKQRIGTANKPVIPVISLERSV